MPKHHTTVDEFQVPPGMILVPASQKQQSHPRVSQYNPPTVTYSNSFKTNKVAPPPSNHNKKTGKQTLPTIQSPLSIISTSPLFQSSYMSKQQRQVPKHVDQSKSSKNKHKIQSIDNLPENPTNKKNTNRSIASHKQQNGHIKDVVKKRPNVVPDDTDESEIDDDETEQGKWDLWLSQPLCLGLTRLSGGLLFGAMILLGTGSLAGLIAASVSYTQDSSTDGQWKILGIVICVIVLITITITLLLFIYCYKNGYMFDEDDDTDSEEPIATRDTERKEQEKPVLKKNYEFNRPNEVRSIPHDRRQDVSPTPSPSPPPDRPVKVNNKKTNTETTIALLRPKDLERCVWPARHAYGGISYRPFFAPQTISRFIQVLPHEIDGTVPPPQVTYQVVAPEAPVVVPPPQVQPPIIQIPAPQPPIIQIPAPQPPIIQIPAPQPPVVEVVEPIQKQPQTIQIPAQQVPVVETKQKQPRIIQVSPPESSIIEVVETKQKKRPRIIQASSTQSSVVEVVETKQKKQPRIIHVSTPQSSVVEVVETKQKKQPRIIKVPAQQSPVFEVIETTEKKSRRNKIHQSQTQPIVVQPTPRYEYVDVEEQRPHRIVQQPQYEIVEEVLGQSTSSEDEVVEIVDAPKRARHHRRKKHKKQNFKKISVKHLKSGH